MNKKLISILLIIVLFTTSALNCYAEGQDPPAPNIVLTDIADKGAKAAAAGEEDSTESERWKDYIGDIETFVYGLIINQLEYAFDVFPASVDLPDGNKVCGLAYTNYSECYANEDGSQYCFEAGFVPFNGELSIPQEDFDSGLYINDLDYDDKKASFIWTYASDQIKNHCVVYGKYLKYGIDDKGVIFYETTDYTPGVCDETIGSLYSYDEGRYLLDLNVGEYLRIAGASLYSQLDFKELEEEINRIIRNQEINLASVDTVSCAYFAQDAIVSYLLSLQEETFLGYSVPALVEAAKSLDPLECFRITANGLVTLELEEGNKASSLMKWLTGSACVVVTIVAVVGAAVFIECPPLSALAGSVAGTAIEILMQVVINEKDLSSVDWRKVAISAAAGALSGFVGPYIYASFGGAAYFVLDSSVDALIGGLERATEAWIDGKNAEGVIKSFGIGVAIGFGLSAGFKVLGKGLSKLGEKIGPVFKKLTEKLPEKLTSRVSVIKSKISDSLHSLKEAADSSIYHSERLSEKIANKQLQRLVSNNSDELLNDSINQLSKDAMIDMDGNEITKEALKRLSSDADDGTTLAFFVKEGERIPIVKKNSMVGVVFDLSKYQNVSIPGGLSANRVDNFVKAAEILKERWLDDPSLIPDSIMTAIKNAGVDLEDLMPGKLSDIIRSSTWVMHENIDKLTISLVPRAMHSEISHMGGVALEKYIKSHMGKELCDRLVSSLSTDAVLVGN